MEPRKRQAFDPQALLATAGLARTVVEYRKGQIIFSQGEPAEAVFYLQKGQVKPGKNLFQATRLGCRETRLQGAIGHSVSYLSWRPQRRRG
jgi:hypothetical protein